MKVHLLVICLSVANFATTANAQFGAPTSPQNGCQFDQQCKGDRICDRGMCVSPAGANNPGSLQNLGIIPTAPTTQMQALPNSGSNTNAISSNANEIRNHLTWCAGDWGVNEGAPEAISYANAIASAGYGPQVAGIIQAANSIPGIAQNVLKRPPVMDAAKALSFVAPDQAIDLAITCQAHNGGVRNLLNSNRDLVLLWLRGQL